MTSDMQQREVKVETSTNECGDCHAHEKDLCNIQMSFMIRDVK